MIKIESEISAPTLEAAALSMVISPHGKVPLGASSANNRPWQGIEDDVELNAMLIQAEDDKTPLLLVAVDALYVGADVREAIVESSGLPVDRVLAFASHSHRAPMIDRSKPELGVPDPRHLSEITTRISSKISELMGSNKSRGSFYAAKGAANHSINRRRWKFATIALKPKFLQVVNAPNKHGIRDETLITGTLRDSVGAAVAVIWNYACHPVAGPQSNVVSAHFPGVVRREIREAENNPTLPVLFIQGFSGNTRPSASAQASSVVRRLQRALTGPVFEDMSRTDYESWTISLARVVNATRSEETRTQIKRIMSSRYEADGTRFVIPGEKTVSFASIKLGEEFAIFALSAEVMSEFAPVVRELSSAKYTCCAGCVDDVVGYLPTQQILNQGGYEASGFCRKFGLESVNPNVESEVMLGFQGVVTNAE